MRISMRVTAVLAIAIVAAGCGLFGDQVRDRFELTALAEQSLPATLSSIQTRSGNTIEVKIVWGNLVVLDGGRMQMSVRMHQVWDGNEVRLVNQADYDGTYERSEMELIVRLTDNEGVARTFTYTIADGGRSLSGVQWDDRAEYVRR
jgi:hypothetical protein